MATIKSQREKLTAHQKKFCKEYVKDFNGVEAILRVRGLAATATKAQRKAAGVQASKLLKEKKIIEFYEAYAKEILGPHEKELMGNVEFWRQVRDGKIEGQGKGKLVVLEEVKELLSNEGFSEGDEIWKSLMALETVVVSPARIGERLKASEALAKWQSMFIEKKEVTMEAQVQIIDDISEDM